MDRAMDIPRIVHDELLHRLEEPQDEHLAQTFRQAQHPAPVPVDGTGGKIQPAASESTALLGPKMAVVVDMAEVDAILDAEERDAVLSDAQKPTWDIVREESRALVGLSIPMMLAVLLEMFPEMLLTMMIGHTDTEHSTEILAAFNLSGLFQMLLVFGLLSGLASAVDTLCSQAFGGKRMVELWLFCQAGLIVYLICLPIVTVLLMMGEPILKALGQDPAIAALAGKLLMVNALSIPFGIAFSVMKSALQAQNIVFPFVLASAIAWPISATVAYYLAFHTSLSYMGIALASPLCWMIKTIVLLPVILRNKVFLDAWPGWQLQRAKALVPSISKLGLSSVLMITFQILGFSFISLLAGLLPNAGVMIAANGIFVSMLAVSFMPLLGICVAGAVRMGNALGAGQARRAKLIGRIVLTSSVGVSVVVAVLVPNISSNFARSFTSDPEADRVATDLIRKFLPIIPLLGFTFGLQGIFRACGKQLLCAQINFACLFVLGVPLGLTFAIKWQAGLAGLWFGNMVGMGLWMLVGLVWLYRVSWTLMAHEAKHNTHLHGEKLVPVADAF